MSTARLNVWITQKGQPCVIDNNPQTFTDPKKPEPIQLFVYVLHCNGEVLDWCGRKYVGMQAKCGHLSVEIPVGCYLVGAVEKPSGRPPLGNHLTHIAIVRANCGDEVCVTLFNPTFHHCAHWLAIAMRDHLTVGGQAMQAEATTAMKNATRAIDGLVNGLTPDPFTTTQAKALGTATTAGAQADSKSTGSKGKKGRK